MYIVNICNHKLNWVWSKAKGAIFRFKVGTERDNPTGKVIPQVSRILNMNMHLILHLVHTF